LSLSDDAVCPLTVEAEAEEGEEAERRGRGGKAMAVMEAGV
jgi:hypothetical protein